METDINNLLIELIKFNRNFFIKWHDNLIRVIDVCYKWQGESINGLLIMKVNNIFGNINCCSFAEKLILGNFLLNAICGIWMNHMSSLN